MASDLCAGLETPFKVGIHIEYVTDLFDFRYFSFGIDVTSPDDINKSFHRDGEELTPWFGSELYDTADLDNGLIKVLKTIEKEFGPGPHCEAAKACVTLLNKNNRELNIYN